MDVTSFLLALLRHMVQQSEVLSTVYIILVVACIVHHQYAIPHACTMRFYVVLLVYRVLISFFEVRRRRLLTLMIQKLTFAFTRVCILPNMSYNIAPASLCLDMDIPFLLVANDCDAFSFVKCCLIFIDCNAELTVRIDFLCNMLFPLCWYCLRRECASQLLLFLVILYSFVVCYCRALALHVAMIRRRDHIELCCKTLELRRKSGRI